MPAPRPWWRGRVGAVLAITIGMVIAFFGWKNQLPWPASLTWNSLAGYLDNFQTWLSDSRNVPHPSVFFVAFNGIATFLDDLVGWITSFFFKLTWVGTTALGTLVVLRFGGRRAALGVARCVRGLRADGLVGAERADVRPHDRVRQRSHSRSGCRSACSRAAPTASSASSRPCSMRCRSSRPSRT